MGHFIGGTVEISGRKTTTFFSSSKTTFYFIFYSVFLLFGEPALKYQILRFLPPIVEDCKKSAINWVKVKKINKLRTKVNKKQHVLSGE